MTEREKKILERAFQKKYAKKIKKIEEKIFWQNKKSEIKQLKKSNRKKLGLTTTKLLSFYLFAIFNVILLYALIAMWHFGDLSYLGVIISDIVGQILVFGIYCIRAYLDTKAEENIKFEKQKIGLPNKLQEKVDELLLSSTDEEYDDEDDNYEYSSSNMEE